MAYSWNNSVDDLLEEIVERLHSYSDYVQFRSVCKSWRSIAPRRPAKLPSRVPCLMIPCNEYFSLFVGDGENYNIELPCRAQDELCKGSSQGWLIIIGETPSIHLINPLTNSYMLLPPVYTFPDVDYFDEKVGHEYVMQMKETHSSPITRSSRYMQVFFIGKVVISRGGNCMAMAIFNVDSNLAYCNLGDKSWTQIEGLSELEDIIQYKETFYAVDIRANIFVIDGSPPVAKLFIAGPKPFRNDYHNKLYLAESKGELLVINRQREVKHRNFQTTRFDVYKIDRKSTDDCKWALLNDLGDKLLFLGQNESFCISTRDIPCPPKGNCIYFTDDDHMGLFLQIQRDISEYDYGVFHLENGRIGPLPVPGTRTCPPPIWLMPNSP